ncbi:MAG TPA: tetratricopeptide repeat protein [bacterium]|nr:tetratricopeptide repeat protein [bacterium]
MMKRLISVSLALALCGAAAGHEHEHEGAPGAAYFHEHALELLRARQSEKAAAFLQYSLDYYPWDVPLNLLYLDVLGEEGLEVLGQAWYEEDSEHVADEAIILFALGRLAEDDADARDYYERALAADRDFTPARVGLAELSYRRGDLEAARLEIERALKQNADEWRAYALRGEIFLALDELEGAVRDFERALDDDPYAPATHAALGEALLLGGEAAAAREEYREAIAWCDDRGEYYLGLGKAQEALGELDAARLAYAAAASRACGNMTVAIAGRKAAGRLAFGAGDMLEATDHITWAATFAPDDAELRAYVGGLYAHVGRPAEAAAEFKRAAELEPENGVYWYLLGSSRARAGEFEAARESLEEAVELLDGEEAAEAARELEAVRAALAEGSGQQEE